MADSKFRLDGILAALHHPPRAVGPVHSRVSSSKWAQVAIGVMGCWILGRGALYITCGFDDTYVCGLEV